MYSPFPILGILKKWGSKLAVATSSSQLRMAVPLVAPPDKMDSGAFKDIALDLPGQAVEIDDLDRIDDLIAGLIDLDGDL